MKRQRGTVRRRPWHGLGLAAWIILLLGLAASLAGALAWGASVQHQADRSFTDSSGTLAQSMNISLQRDNDVMATAGTLVTTESTLTNTEFQRWFTVLGSSHRYPGALGFAFIARVPQGQVPTYRAEIQANPPLGAYTTAAFSIRPPGSRPYYCFIRYAVIQFPTKTAAALGSITEKLSSLTDPGFDSCQTSMSPIFAATERTADNSVPGLATLLDQLGLNDTKLPNRIIDSIGGISPVTIVAPVYANGTVPATAAARQADLLGWTEGIFNAYAVCSPAVSALHGGAVSLAFHNPDGQTLVVSQAGTEHSHEFTRTVDFDAGGAWSVTMSSPEGAWTDGPSALVQGLFALLLGLIVTILLFLLVGLLNRSRASALEMVAEKTEELRFQALHDSLTGLPNRLLILDRAEQLLARARRSETSVAFLFIDLDGFKSVNDSLGHRVGDLLLQTVARRFTNALREVDTVGRLAGDEFVVLAEVAQRTDANLLAQRLLDSLAAPLRVADDRSMSVHISASIGIATGDSGSPEDMLRDADIALYEAKDAGKNRYVAFVPRMKRDFQARFDLEKDLQVAIEEGQFFLVYQPVVRLSDLSIVGTEALIRWRHPTRGVVPPLEFIGALETSGHIVEVGRWVLLESCREAKRWHDLGYRISVSANASAKQFEDAGFLEDVRAALADSGLDPSYLVIEITETALMHEADITTIRLNLLHQLGVRIAIDDFGTGYSSLAYLQRFPVDTIKIDQYFVASMTESSDSRVLLKLFVQLGNALGISTLAEGIELVEHLDELREESCARGQGYLFARPLESAAMVALLGTGIPEPQRETAPAEDEANDVAPVTP